MHLFNGQAAPCMGGGAWVGARCWLAVRGRGLFVLGYSEHETPLWGGCHMKWILEIQTDRPHQAKPYQNYMILLLGIVTDVIGRYDDRYG